MTVITLGLLEKQLEAALAFVKEKIEALRWENRQLSLTREAALGCARNTEPGKSFVLELMATWPSPIPYTTCSACGCLTAVAGTRCPNCDAEVQNG